MTDRISAVTDLIDSVLDGHERQDSPESAYTSLAPEGMCWRCQTTPTGDGPSDLCDGCRRFLLEDSDTDPTETAPPTAEQMATAGFYALPDTIDWGAVARGAVFEWADGDRIQLSGTFQEISADGQEWQTVGVTSFDHTPALTEIADTARAGTIVTLHTTTPDDPQRASIQLDMEASDELRAWLNISALHSEPPNRAARPTTTVEQIHRTATAPVELRMSIMTDMRNLRTRYGGYLNGRLIRPRYGGYLDGRIVRPREFQIEWNEVEYDRGYGCLGTAPTASDSVRHHRRHPMGASPQRRHGACSPSRTGP